MATDRFSFASVETRPLFGLSRLRTLSYTAVSVPRRRISSKFPGLWIGVSCSNTQRRRSVACLSSEKTQASAPADSSASSSSAPEFGLVSTTACSDGSTVFLFGDVSETATPDVEKAEANDDLPDEDSKAISAPEVPDEDEAEISEVAIKSLSTADIIGPEVVDNEETAVPSSSSSNDENIELEISDEGKENSDEVIAAKSLSIEDKLELQSPEKKYQEESTVSVCNNSSEIASTTLTGEGIDIGLALEAPVQVKGEVTEVDLENLSGSDTGTISTRDVVLDENHQIDVPANVGFGHTAELEEVTDIGSSIDDDSDSNNVLDTELLDSSSLGLETTAESPQPSTPLDVSSSSTVLEESLDLGTEESTVLEEETPLEDLTASSNGRPEKAASEEEVLQATKAVDITDSINSEELLQSNTPGEGVMIDETLAEGELLQATEAVDMTDSINSEELLHSDTPDEGVIEETSAEEEVVLQATEAVDITDSINSEELLQSDTPDEGAMTDKISTEEVVLQATEAVDTTDSINSVELLQSHSPDEGDTTAIVKETSAEEEVLQVKAVDITESVNLEKLSGSETSDDDDTTAPVGEISQENDRDEDISTGSEVEIIENNVKEVIEELPVASAIDEHSADTSVSENCEETEMLHAEADESEKIEAISSGDENVSTEISVKVAENVTEVVDLPTAPVMNEDSAESAETSISENSEEPEKLHAQSVGEEVKDNAVVSTLETDTTAAPSVSDNGVISNQEAVEDGEESNGIAEVSSILQSQSEDVILDSEEIIPIEFSLSSAAVSLPYPSKALTGGKDAYFIAGKNWVGVADGAAHWSLKGTSDGLFAEELMKNCKAIVSDSKSSSVKDVLVTSVAETGSVGISTVLLAHFDGQVLSVATVGDSGFIVIRDGTILKRSVPMAHEFYFPVQIGKGDDPSELVECYRIELALNDVIISATDGLFDNLYDQEIATIVHNAFQAGLTPQEIAEILGKGAEEAARFGSGPSPFSDSAHAAGYVGYSGGKLDHITVIVSVVGPQH